MTGREVYGMRMQRWSAGAYRDIPNLAWIDLQQKPSAIGDFEIRFAVGVNIDAFGVDPVLMRDFEDLVSRLYRILLPDGGKVKFRATITGLRVSSTELIEVVARLDEAPQLFTDLEVPK